MTREHEDYLWDPASPPVPEIARFEALLRPHGSARRQLAPPVRKTRKPRAWPRVVALAASLVVLLAASLLYRFTWQTNAPWQLRVDGGSAARATLLKPGEIIETNTSQRAVLDVARIGEIELHPDSSLELVKTGRRQHRVVLNHGRMSAKVWAPPAWFGVAVPNAVVLDLGCEFDLRIEKSGAGVVSVKSGWVAYVTEEREVLVPEAFEMKFQGDRVGLPVRPSASPRLRALADLLSALDPDEQLAVADALADLAMQDDAFTLLSAMTRTPTLARSRLYDRLAGLLHAPSSELHRSRWQRGDVAAINEWWERFPSRPKAWWLNWADAIGAF